jgi:hypothetical protein
MLEAILTILLTLIYWYYNKDSLKKEQLSDISYSFLINAFPTLKSNFDTF